MIRRSQRRWTKRLTQKLFLAATVLILSSPAFADVVVSFDEGAPKDRFTFHNTGACTLTAATLELDLSGSASGLIFDVTSTGAGVEVFQPLELVAGKAALTMLPTVKDGDNKLVLNIGALGPDERIAFTIDVDDTAGGREITVSGSEIEGAAVALTVENTSTRASFSSNAEASLITPVYS